MEVGPKNATINEDKCRNAQQAKLGLWALCTILSKAGAPIPGLHHASLPSYTADDFLHPSTDSMEIGPKNATIS
jgi:hypothetical protein